MFYIITNNGFLKLYYTGLGIQEANNQTDGLNFTATLRKAKVFKSVEEAKQTISNKNLENCLIVNGLGQVQ